MFTSLILIGVNFIILFIIYIFFKNRLNKYINSSLIIDKIREEVDEMVIELNQTTNRNISLIEERLERLQGLLEKADKHVLRLSGIVEKKRENVKMYDDLRKSVPLVEPSGIRNSVSSRDKVLSMFKDGVPKDAIAQKLDKTLAEVDLILSLNQQKEGPNE